MRKVLLALALLGVATSAWADPAILEGGVFIAHYEAAVQYCIDPTDYCAMYAPYAISDPSQAVVQLPDETNAVWYVLAAWQGTEDKTWCGTEFGFGPYAGAAFTYFGFAPCFPVTGGLEIPTAGWPGPVEGTAFVTTGDPWMGNYAPVYWFAGKGYEYYGPTVIQIDVDPPTSFCGFSNCMNPPASFSVAAPQRGGMGIGTPGYQPVFPPPPTPWACCIETEPFCVMLMEQECLLAGGEWLGPEYTCEPVNPCPQMWACCVGGICTMMFEENCTLVGGTWLQGVTCDPNPCEAVCCFQMPELPHGCEIMLEAECATAGGHWHPDWTTCEPNPCEIWTPTETTSWGQIKSMYR